MPHAEVDGVRLFYEVSGDGPLLPAVLVMGLGGDAHAWEQVVPVLAASRRVLVLDNRGIGRSDKPAGPYSTAGLARDLAAVMDAAGIESAHVAGISLGGMIAQELALSAGHRVRSLALLATYARSGDEAMRTADAGVSHAVANRGGRDVPAMLRAIADGSVTLELAQVLSFLMPLIFSQEYLVREAAYLQRFFLRSAEYGLSGEGFAGQLAAALDHDAVERLAAVRAPTLVVTGTVDRLISPHHSRALAERIPGARLVEIEGGTHGLNLEFHAPLAETLAAFFAEHDASAAS